MINTVVFYLVTEEDCILFMFEYRPKEGSSVVVFVQHGLTILESRCLPFGQTVLNSSGNKLTVDAGVYVSPDNCCVMWKI